MEDRRKVLSIARPPQFYLAVGLAERSQMDCVDAEPDEPIRALCEEQPDLVLVDCGDPTDGCLAAIHKVRLVSGVPIMALIPEGSSARDVLELGADAVAYTPIRWDEFEARIDGLVGRFAGGSEPNVLVDGPVSINRRDRSVVCAGHEIHLTATEFRMLVAFACRPGEALGHDELVELIWRDPHHAKEELKIYVSYLRKKFRAAGVDPIETVRGIGYRYLPRGRHGGGVPN